MLLDFHLAQPPIDTRERLPANLGGTPRYMAPEQQAAFDQFVKEGASFGSPK